MPANLFIFHFVTQAVTTRISSNFKDLAMWTWNKKIFKMTAHVATEFQELLALWATNF